MKECVLQSVVSVRRDLLKYTKFRNEQSPFPEFDYFIYEPPLALRQLWQSDAQRERLRVLFGEQIKAGGEAQIIPSEPPVPTLRPTPSPTSKPVVPAPVARRRRRRLGKKKNESHISQGPLRLIPSQSFIRVEYDDFHHFDEKEDRGMHHKDHDIEDHKTLSKESIDELSARDEDHLHVSLSCFFHTHARSPRADKL